MGYEIKSYYADITNKGRAKLTFTTDEEEITLAFEKTYIGSFAAVCSLLNHGSAKYEMRDGEHHFIIEKT